MDLKNSPSPERSPPSERDVLTELAELGYTPADTDSTYGRAAAEIEASRESLEAIRAIVREWRESLEEGSEIMIRGDDFMEEIEELLEREASGKP